MLELAGACRLVWWCGFEVYTCEGRFEEFVSRSSWSEKQVGMSSSQRRREWARPRLCNVPASANEMPSLAGAQGGRGTRVRGCQGVGLEKNRIRGQSGVQKTGRADANRVEEGRKRYLPQSTDSTQHMEPETLLTTLRTLYATNEGMKDNCETT